MRLTLTIASLALALGLAAPPTSAALPPGISGAWYNPAQSGHGLTVEMLSGGRALVFWHVFDPDGNPVHLYIDGKVDGGWINGQAYVGHGMRFGSFDRADHVLDHWGSVSLAFEHCNAAELEWRPDGPAGAGYAAGRMPLQRLTAIEGLPCDFNEPLLLPAGVYEGAIDWGSRTFPFTAAVDSDGRLWGTFNPAGTPTMPYVGMRTFVFAGTPNGAPQALTLAVSENMALANAPWRGPDRVELDLDLQADGSLAGQAVLSDGFHLVRFRRGPEEGIRDPLQRSFDPAVLRGLRFRFDGRTQFFDFEQEVRFLAGGAFCVDTYQETCALQGTISAEDPGLAMFAIRGRRGGTEYAGKGWVLYQDEQPRGLVMVATGTGGSHDGAGLGIVAERAP